MKKNLRRPAQRPAKHRRALQKTPKSHPSAQQFVNNRRKSLQHRVLSRKNGRKRAFPYRLPGTGAAPHGRAARVGLTPTQLPHFHTTSLPFPYYFLTA
jgi:hypothetical protein